MFSLSKEMVQSPQSLSLDLDEPFGKGLSMGAEGNQNLTRTYSVLGTVRTPLCIQGSGGSARVSSVPQITQLGREWVLGRVWGAICISAPSPSRVPLSWGGGPS